jgi:hypothetical protein
MTKKQKIIKILKKGLCQISNCKNIAFISIRDNEWPKQTLCEKHYAMESLAQQQMAGVEWQAIPREDINSFLSDKTDSEVEWIERMWKQREKDWANNRGGLRKMSEECGLKRSIG